MKKFIKKISIILLLMLIAEFILLFTLESFSQASTNELIGNLEISSSSLSEGMTRDYSAPYPNISALNGQVFYIKNLYSGKYLDVAGGIGANGTNVQQYDYNGSLAQQWYFYSYGDGNYGIFSPVGNDGKYKYSLNINGASGDNGANVQIWSIDGSDDAQKFSVAKTNFETYVLFSKCSNYSKIVSVNSPTEDEGCILGRNVDQYTWQGHYNESWILEPAGRSTDYDLLAISYARVNYDRFIPAYPNLTGIGGDCANFVSQTLLASGIHFENEWYTYRKNGNYSAPNNVNELNNTWSLANKSPWISASEFEKYWQQRKHTQVVKGSDILNNPNWYLNSGFYQGDVVQILDDGILGIGRKAYHTMYITGINNDTHGRQNFSLTYHSSPNLDKNFLTICEENPNRYFKFFAF